MTKLPHRIVWLFGLGYFLAYAPYVSAVKSVTAGGASGLFILPAVIAGTILTLTLLVALLGWHEHLEGRFSAHTIASGVATAAIIATTTLAYSFDGISILLALLMMRGGVLIVAPIVDAISKRRVRWFSRVALGLSLTAIAIALADVESYAMSIAAVVNLAIYLTGYCVRLPMMSRIAKVDDLHVTRRYFVEETIVALGVLAMLAVAVTIFEPASVWTSPQLVPSIGIGGLYALLYVAGTLIYLDRREHSFCIPLNRGASLLSGVAATYLMAALANGRDPRPAELFASALIIGAMVLLSPMHHAVEVLHEAWRLSRTAASRRLPLE